MRIPQPGPTLAAIFERPSFSQDLRAAFIADVGPTVDGRYSHWETLHHKTPPEGLTLDQWWAGIKFSRQQILRPFPLISPDGRPFQYSLPDPALELLHWIDQHAAGEIMVSETIRDAGDRRRYLVNSLFEESITSSQLEGASATRRVAKEMLRSGRAPRDRSETMILNNYRAMSQLNGLSKAPLTPEVVFDLQRTLTEGTLDNLDAAGRMQRHDEERVHVEYSDGTITHIPPPASELPDRMQRMCEFANSEGASQGFMHPVVRAILLHLWLAYDHPFEDGNGRTARALFYREMLAHDYWLFEYVSISRLLVRAPADYGRAFLYTETDELDATYFLLHQLRIIRRALEDLMEYLVRKMAELRETLQLLRKSDVNHRQLALLTNALQHSDAEYTVTSHSSSHRVTRQSARTDLLELEDRGLLDRRVVGRRFYFMPARDLREKLTASNT